MNWLGPAEWAIIALSLKVSAVAILGILPLAFALAWVLARKSFPGKVLVDATVHLPLVTTGGRTSDGPPAAGPAPGGDRLAAAPRVRA